MLGTKSLRRHVQAASVAKHAEDEEFRRRVQEARVAKYANDEEHQRAVIQRSVDKYRKSARHRDSLKKRRLARDAQRKKNRSKITHVTRTFKEMIAEAPNHICSVCHRRLLRKQVVVCKAKGYIQKGKHIEHLARRCISKKIPSSML